MRVSKLTKSLLIAGATATLLGGFAVPAQAAPRATFKIETYTQELSAAAIAAGADRTTDYARYGGCQLAGGALSCWANPAAGGNTDPTPLWASATFAVPAQVATRALPGTLRMKVTPTFSRLSGKVRWDYGGSGASLKFAHLPRKKPKAPKFVSLNGAFTNDGIITPTVDFGFDTGTRATFERVTVTYAYVAPQR